jgi:hypothetical protein
MVTKFKQDMNGFMNNANSLATRTSSPERGTDHNGIAAGGTCLQKISIPAVEKAVSYHNSRGWRRADIFDVLFQ